MISAVEKDEYALMSAAERSINTPKSGGLDGDNQYGRAPLDTFMKQANKLTQ